MKMSYNNISVLFTGTGARALCASQSYTVFGHYGVMPRILNIYLNNLRKEKYSAYTVPEAMKMFTGASARRTGRMYRIRRFGAFWFRTVCAAV